MYTLLHSYVICVYTYLRFQNLFVLFCRITWKMKEMRRTCSDFVGSACVLLRHLICLLSFG